MPIAAIFIGAILVIVGIRGTEHEFGQQLESDFGGGNFVAWAALVIGAGALGYSKTLRPVSNGLLFLIVLVMAIVYARQGGIQAAAADAQTAPSPAAAIPLTNYGGSSGGGIAGILGAAAQAAGPIGGFFGL